MKFLLLAALAATSFAFAASPEAEVKAAIEEWKTAVIQKNVPVLQKLLHDQITYEHSSSLTETKAQAIAAFTAPTMQYKAIDMADTTYRTFGNTVLVKTNMTVKNAEKGVDKSLGLSVLMVWIKDQGRWQLVARQSTRLP
ncbi:MAG: nuclear transport factor 2 family protein [Bryobacter sp.]|nr:nuclear transport factor 2 family protein [Bryobacter sp.]